MSRADTGLSNNQQHWMLLLGTDTQEENRHHPEFYKEYGELLSHLKGHIKEGFATIFDGPDTTGTNVYKIIANTVLEVLEKTKDGKTEFHFAAHSRGAVETILVAHELQYIKTLASLKQLTIENYLDINKFINGQKGKHSVLETLQKRPKSAATSIFTYSIQYEIKRDRILTEKFVKALEFIKDRDLSALTIGSMVLLDPVPGGNLGVLQVGWQDERFYKIPEIVAKCTTIILLDERTQCFAPVVAHAQNEKRTQVTVLPLRGNHGTASGNRYSQDPAGSLKRLMLPERAVESTYMIAAATILESVIAANLTEKHDHCCTGDQLVTAYLGMPPEKREKEILQRYVDMKDCAAEFTKLRDRNYSAILGSESAKKGPLDKHNQQGRLIHIGDFKSSDSAATLESKNPAYVNSDHAMRQACAELKAVLENLKEGASLDSSFVNDCVVEKSPSRDALAEGVSKFLQHINSIIDALIKPGPYHQSVSGIIQGVMKFIKGLGDQRSELKNELDKGIHEAVSKRIIDKHKEIQDSINGPLSTLGLLSKWDEILTLECWVLRALYFFPGSVAMTTVMHDKLPVARKYIRNKLFKKADDEDIQFSDVNTDSSGEALQEVLYLSQIISDSLTIIASGNRSAGQYDIALKATALGVVLQKASDRLNECLAKSNMHCLYSCLDILSRQEDISEQDGRFIDTYVINLLDNLYRIFEKIPVEVPNDGKPTEQSYKKKCADIFASYNIKYDEVSAELSNVGPATPPEESPQASTPSSPIPWEVSARTPSPFIRQEVVVSSGVSSRALSPISEESVVSSGVSSRAPSPISGESVVLSGASSRASPPISRGSIVSSEESLQAPKPVSTANPKGFSGHFEEALRDTYDLKEGETFKLSKHFLGVPVADDCKSNTDYSFKIFSYIVGGFIIEPVKQFVLKPVFELIPYAIESAFHHLRDNIPKPTALKYTARKFLQQCPHFVLTVLIALVSMPRLLVRAVLSPVKSFTHASTFENQAIRLMAKSLSSLVGLAGLVVICFVCPMVIAKVAPQVMASVGSLVHNTVISAISSVLSKIASFMGVTSSFGVSIVQSVSILSVASYVVSQGVQYISRGYKNLTRKLVKMDATTRPKQMPSLPRFIPQPCSGTPLKVGLQVTVRSDSSRPRSKSYAGPGLFNVVPQKDDTALGDVVPSARSRPESR
ncbi:MAG: hypothetical protein COB66_06380 [Coxiella sp. (in: Bacteria)]|nr:MAG: hypothetical protein COB66_06380 [Coxiella sp. (in: g-proteobacteria)]